jgi:hypothetical protein
VGQVVDLPRHHDSLNLRGNRHGHEACHEPAEVQNAQRGVWIVARQAHAAGKLIIAALFSAPGVLQIEMSFAGASSTYESRLRA